MSDWLEAVIGLGSNMAQPVDQLRTAITLLRQLTDVRALQYSSFYASAPVGSEYQHHPDYVNAVAVIETRLSARALLEALLELERQCGRSREVAHAPRTLDLDLLLYGNQTIAEPGLDVPHPRMHERAFVLEPLLELRPLAEIPGRGTVVSLSKMCQHQPLIRL